MGEDVWGDTTILLPEGLPEKWTDSVTGKEISGRGLLSAGAVLSLFPVAMLMNEEKS
jgi:(1->4)-alpha-D-glucan 1-alpha-D-glucosylmutase